MIVAATSRKLARKAAQDHARCSLAAALILYGRYFDAICTDYNLAPAQGRALLASYRRYNASPAFRVASYARQLALYLVNTEHDVPQAVVARAGGLGFSSVCGALRAIEDMRDDPNFSAFIDCIVTRVRRS